MTLPLVLVVTDDSATKQLVRQCVGTKFALRDVGSEVTQLTLLNQIRPDLVLLDDHLPGQDAFRFVSDIRAFSGAPLMLLLDRAQPPQWGIDMPHIRKHMCANGLATRIESELLGCNPIIAEQPLIIQGALVMGLADRKAFFRGRQLRLGPAEFDLLACLASHPGKRLSRGHLCQRALRIGTATPEVDFWVDDHLRALRAALAEGGAMIVDVGGGRYQFSTCK